MTTMLTQKVRDIFVKGLTTVSLETQFSGIEDVIGIKDALQFAQGGRTISVPVVDHFSPGAVRPAEKCSLLNQVF